MKDRIVKVEGKTEKECLAKLVELYGRRLVILERTVYAAPFLFGLTAKRRCTIIAKLIENDAGGKMGFFIDDFFDGLDIGTLSDARILSEKWDEIFQRKELTKNAVVLEDEEDIGKNESEENFAENKDDAPAEVEQMSDDDLKLVALALADRTALGVYEAFRGKTRSIFKSGDAYIFIAGTEEDDIEVRYRKGGAELVFYFNGDDIDIEELEKVDDEYDTGIYIFQKFYMSLKIDGKTEIEFRRIRKKDRHAIRENDVTLTEFLERFSNYSSFSEFPTRFAEHALRFMQRLQKVAEEYNMKKLALAEAERKKDDEAERLRKEELLKNI